MLCWLVLHARPVFNQSLDEREIQHDFAVLAPYLNHRRYQRRLLGLLGEQPPRECVSELPCLVSVAEVLSVRVLNEVPLHAGVEIVARHFRLNPECDSYVPASATRHSTRLQLADSRSLTFGPRRVFAWYMHSVIGDTASCTG